MGLLTRSRKAAKNQEGLFVPLRLCVRPNQGFTNNRRGRRFHTKPDGVAPRTAIMECGIAMPLSKRRHVAALQRRAADGGLSSTQAYAYNTANEMTKGVYEGVTTNFTYDAWGNQISKYVSGGPSAARQRSANVCGGRYFKLLCGRLVL